MSFTHKTWKDFPDTSTPISASALTDVEDRLSSYTDASTALVGSDVATRAEKANYTVNVKDYGALGDSSQDEIANIEAAIAAVTARSAARAGAQGVVEFPAGIYKISRSIVLPTNVTLRGQEATGRTNSASNIQPWSAFSDFMVKSTADQCGIENLRLYANNPFTTVEGISLTGNDCYIDRVHVENVFGRACYIEGRAHVITNSYLSGFNSRDGNVTFYNAGGAYVGGGLHVNGSNDGLFAFNEISGGCTYSAVRTTQLYHCSVYNKGGGINRWIANVIENGDVGMYVEGSGGYARQQFIGNRFEWNAGHGVQLNFASQGVYVGNSYNNNSLAQNDRYYGLYSAFGAARNSFTGELFTFDGSGGSNKPAVAIYEGQSGSYFRNFYENIVIEDTAWVSAPWFVVDTSTSPNIRGACQQWRNLPSAPTSGTFTTGETYTIGAPTNNTVYQRIIAAGGTIGTLAGVTGSMTIGTPTLTVNDGTLVPLGAFIAVAGAISPKNRVIAKNGNVLTLDGNASATVSSAAVSYVGPALRDFGYVENAGAVVYDPPSLATGTETTTQTVSVTSAALGDRVDITFANDLQGLRLWGWVSAAGTVSFRFRNDTGGTIDLASGTVKAWVRK